MWAKKMTKPNYNHKNMVGEKKWFNHGAERLCVLENSERCKLKSLIFHASTQLEDMSCLFGGLFGWAKKIWESMFWYRIHLYGTNRLEESPCEENTLSRLGCYHEYVVCEDRNLENNFAYYVQDREVLKWDRVKR